jgi:hypothetical protein
MRFPERFGRSLCGTLRFAGRWRGKESGPSARHAQTFGQMMPARAGRDQQESAFRQIGDAENKDRNRIFRALPIIVNNTGYPPHVLQDSSSRPFALPACSREGPTKEKEMPHAKGWLPGAAPQVPSIFNQPSDEWHGGTKKPKRPNTGQTNWGTPGTAWGLHGLEHN